MLLASYRIFQATEEDHGAHSLKAGRELLPLAFWPLALAF